MHTSKATTDWTDHTVRTMVDSESEMLREEEEAELGERKPFESARQATYEDSVPPDPDWEEEDP
jgi:hypothetical protein